MIIIDTLDEIANLDTKTVIMSTDEKYLDQIVFLNLDQEHPEFLSSYGLLNDTFLLRRFLEKLKSDGYEVYCLRDAVETYELIESFYEPLEIKGLTLPATKDAPPGLFPYQDFALRKAMRFYETVGQKSTFFFNHATGTGKSVLSVALIQEMMINKDQFDYTLVFTLKKNKINFCRDINSFTEANAVQNEGTTKKRASVYADPQYNVYVMNYEKTHFDFEPLREMIKGKRVLFIFDEIQKVLAYPGAKKNRARKGIDNLLRVCKEYFLAPTSATVINGDPVKYWRVYDTGRVNPLGTGTQFRNEYGRTYSVWNFNHYEQKTDWDIRKMIEVRHIVAPQTHSVRKTDPGVKEHFKSTTFLPEVIQMSDEDRIIYEEIKSSMKEMFDENPDATDKDALPYVSALRYLCNTAESFIYSENPICQAVVESGIELSSKTSSKMESVLDKVEDILDQGDKVVIFTHWTNLSLFPISRMMTARKIPHVQHHGAMTDKQAQAAQDRFKADRSCQVFLTSDAGSHALSFPEARYVINYEIPHSYDDLAQRCARIDRATSYFDGITSYAYYTENTVEVGIWETNNKRRQMSEVLQGTVESLEREKPTELVPSRSLRDLVFG